MNKPTQPHLLGVLAGLCFATAQVLSAMLVTRLRLKFADEVMWNAVL